MQPKGAQLLSTWRELRVTSGVGIRRGAGLRGTDLGGSGREFSAIVEHLARGAGVRGVPRSWKNIPH